MSATAKDVAAFMKEQLHHKHWLYQETIVWEISRRFGTQYTYTNENGNLAIGRDVLKEFRAITEGEVVWERAERAWRKRRDRDGTGRVVD